MPCLFCLVPFVQEKHFYPEYKFLAHLPLFLIGAALADMESDKEHRPLDNIRELKGAKKFAFNSLMIIIILLYGGNKYERRCQD